MISEAVWKSISKAPSDPWIKLLNDYLPAHGIDTPARIAMFLAQASHESGGFMSMVENLNYSAQGLANTWPKRYKNQDGKPNALANSISRKPELIANSTYSGRMGNGGPESGDGWKYRGRGIFQLTGRTNYEKFFADTGISEPPEKMSEPTYAILTACWFWNSRKLNEYADKGDIKGCTLAINGGTIGLAHRTELYEKLRKLL